MCVTEKVPVAVFFGMMRRTSGCRVYGRPAVTSGFKLAAWTKRKPLSDAGAKCSSCKAARLAATTAAAAATFSLLPAVIDAVPSVPVVAAGGIADGRTVAAALALGADAVWVGTRLLASFEAYAHPQYKDRGRRCWRRGYCSPFYLRSGIPRCPTRGLRNRIVREWERREGPPPYKVVPDSELPVIGQARFYGQEFPMKRFCGFPPTPEFTGDLEEMSLLAGESVGQTKRLMSAARIIEEMISGAEAVIRKRLGSMVVD